MPQPYRNGELVIVIDCANLSRSARPWCGGEPKPDGRATFPTAWFETKEGMYAWLTS